MKMILNLIATHKWTDEGGVIQNIIVDVVDFVWMSGITIFDVIYVKDIYFSCE